MKADAVATGFCLVSGRGHVYAHTLRQTAAEARDVMFPIGDVDAAQHWASRQGEGWRVERVAARLTLLGAASGNGTREAGR